MAPLTDPSNASKADLNRKAFIALSGGALALSTSMAAALAAGEGFGKFHDPIVSEDDPAIVVERPTLKRPGGDVDSYAALPRGASKNAPGVVVVQAIWGIDTQLRDVVRRFAKAGYVTIAPDLFARLNAPSGDHASDYAPYRALAEKLSDDQVDGDLQAGGTWIRARAGVGSTDRPPKVGITGFCMGGGIAFRQAISKPAFDAVAVWYGKVRQRPRDGGPATEPSLAYADALSIPLLGSFGGRDTSIPVEEVRQLDRRLRGAHDIKIYDEAGHAFFDDQRSSYVPSAATDAWTRTLAWFHRYLTAA